MADPLAQIQQRQMQNQERFVVEQQRDLDWRSTFDQIPPDQILRETRNMTDLVNGAIERKMELAAQTDANAQKIYLNNERFKSWQGSQALRDDKTRASVKAEDALTRSRTAKELLDQSNAARKAREEEQTALAHWEMNQIEDNPSATEADKIAQLRSFGGRYPRMDAPTRQRHTEMVSRFTPLSPEGLQAPEGLEVDRVSKNRDGSPNVVFKPKAAPAGFVGTPEQARAHYGPDATIHETSKGVWTGTIKSPDSGVISGLEKERNLHQKAWEKASARRVQAARVIQRPD